MPLPNGPRRLIALATSSVLAVVAATPALAAPPPITPLSNPPGRVGRVAQLAGSVSFHTADADQWSRATLNFPLTSGDAFWTEPGARADLQVGGSRVVLAPSTELDMKTLNDVTFGMAEPEGEAFLDLRAMDAGDTTTVQTPRGAVQITAAGRYDVIAGDASHPTRVTVVDGAARVTGDGLSLDIGPRQTAAITGSTTLQGVVGPIEQSAFLTGLLAPPAPVKHPASNVPAVARGMTGSQDLEAQGDWAENPNYGAVWFPPVEAGWVPYRHGTWSYVRPWGWTWIDDAPWGFAPFHYGRWAEVDGRWGWTPVSPGYAEPIQSVPVYAPALVSFVDFGAAAGAAFGFAAGVLDRPVGWLPLGPREPYFPPYRADLAYVRRINVSVVQNVTQNITNITVINNRTALQTFVNRGATTVVPVSAMVGSHPIAALAHALPPEQVGRAQAMARAPVVPTATTTGVTRAVAREFNFVPVRPAQAFAGPALSAGPRLAPPAVAPRQASTPVAAQVETRSAAPVHVAERAVAPPRLTFRPQSEHPAAPPPSAFRPQFANIAPRPPAPLPVRPSPHPEPRPFAAVRMAAVQPGYRPPPPIVHPPAPEIRASPPPMARPSPPRPAPLRPAPPPPPHNERQRH